MKIYFINQPNSFDNKYDIKKVEKGVVDIISECKGMNPQKIYLYSSDESDAIATSNIIARKLKMIGKRIKQKNISFDRALNGRNYGDLENFDDVEIKKPINIIKHPKQILSFALSQLGFDNALKIETKKAFADRVFSAIYQIVLNHEENNDIILISAPKDVYEIMQKDDGIHSMCFFGNEKMPNASLKSNEVQTIKGGEKKLIEAGMPKFDAKSNRFVPFWEGKAYESNISKMIEDVQKQK